jgi:hypothetical protein
VQYIFVVPAENGPLCQLPEFPVGPHSSKPPEADLCSIPREPTFPVQVIDQEMVVLWFEVGLDGLALREFWVQEPPPPPPTFTLTSSIVASGLSQVKVKLVAPLFIVSEAEPPLKLAL